MKRVELLSPVGNMEMAYMAIHNGADAIYLAGKLYGARKFAKNFTNEELVSIIKYAHLYGVKVYVTVNIIIYESELYDALNYIEFLHKNNVDALIMQDLGLMKLVREYYPNLEIHASTQCHNHNNGGLSFLKELGIKRVVLDREMSIDEIKKLDVDIEKEVFIYGALCVSYSGCCLFSSLNGGRSGNRGECTQCCRLPYQLLDYNKRVVSQDGNYLLSTKDLNTLEHLDQLIELGIDSLKIEGRMKSPGYVGYVTRCARKMIDSYYQGKEAVLSEEEKINLKKLFHRGFTEGYLFNSTNILNQKSPNHQGIEIGKVVDVTRKRVKIRITNDVLYQNDGIRFQHANEGMIVNLLYNEKGLLVKKIEKDCIGYVDVKLPVKKNDIILKTMDYYLEKELKSYVEKKISIYIQVKALLYQPLEIMVSDGINTIVVRGDAVSNALTKEVDSQSIIKQLSKLGNTPYLLEKIDINKDDNIFIRIGSLNELRREFVEKLTDVRRNVIPHEVVVLKKQDMLLKENKTNKINIHVLARTEEQLEECLRHSVTSIYVVNEELYQKYKDKSNVYLRVKRVNEQEKKYKNERLLIGDIGSAYLYCRDNQVVTDYYLNVVNHANVDLLNEFHSIERITLSVELSYTQIKELMSRVVIPEKLEMIIYGRAELMIMKSKLYDGNCYIENHFHHQFPVIIEDNLSHVMHHEVINYIQDIKEYQKVGICNFRVELFDETREDVRKILDSFKVLD